MITSAPGPTPASSTAPRSPEKININTDSKTELKNVPGIGAATAEKIISARPFSSLNELRKVDEIGEAKLESISRHTTVR